MSFEDEGNDHRLLGSTVLNNAINASVGSVLSGQNHMQLIGTTTYGYPTTVTTLQRIDFDKPDGARVTIERITPSFYCSEKVWRITHKDAKGNVRGVERSEADICDLLAKALSSE